MHLYLNKTWDTPLSALSPISALTIFQLKKLYIYLHFRGKKFQERHNSASFFYQRITLMEYASSGIKKDCNLLVLTVFQMLK